MPHLKNFSETAINRLPRPADKAVTWWCPGFPGFGIRVSPRGKKVWICMYEVRGKSITETIAPLVIMNLADAREHARTSMRQARKGIDPRREREAQAAQEKAEEQAKAFTFEKLAERYLDEYARVNTKQSTQHETERHLRQAAAHFGATPVRDIVKADVLKVIARTPGQTQGLTELTNRLVAVRKVFHWAIGQDLVSADPSLGVAKPVPKAGKRDRVLSDAEIVSFWQACDELGWPYGAACKLMLLTTARKNEVAGMPWSELDDLENRVWHLPGSRTKNSKAIDIHLSDLAMSIIEAVPRFADPFGHDFLFSLRGNRPVSTFAYAKEKLDKLMGTTEPWRLHDLRRTATTGMAKLSVAPHICEKILNHESGGEISGVAAVYNQFKYLPERKAALDAWGQFVADLVDPERGRKNVVPMRAGR
jgi:integrase